MALAPDQLVLSLKALGDVTRLRLLALLSGGERTVKDLTDILGQSQPRISRHLKLLTDAGLVDRTQEGSWVYYRVADDTGSRPLVSAALASLDRDDPVVRRDRERLADVRQAGRDAADRYFAAHAADWNRIRALHVPEQDVEQALLDMVGPGPFANVLDVGTGTGRMLQLFSDRYENGLGIDRSQSMLAIARTNLEDAGVEAARVRTGDVLNLSVQRDAFDLVVIHQVLHFLDDPSLAIVQAAAALAPGGRLLVADFAPHDMEFLRHDHAHKRLGFSHDQVRQWASAAGLGVEGIIDLAAPDAPKPALTVTIWCARAPELKEDGEGRGS